MVWVVLRLMGLHQKVTREGSGVEGVKEVEEADRLNHKFMRNALHARSNDRHVVSS